MFDLRYHVASLAAVFLALVIGILVGVGLSGRGFVDDAERTNLNNQIRDLREERAAADELLDAAERRARAMQDFAAVSYSTLVSRRLDGVSVGLVFAGEVDRNVDFAVRQAVTDGGGRLLRTRAIVLPLPVEDLEGALAEDTALVQYLGKGGLGRLGRDLGRELVAGGRTPLWEVVTRLIVAERGGPAAPPVDAVVVVRTEPPQRGPTGEFLTGLYTGLARSAVPAVGVEITGTEPSTVPVFQRHGLSTVDGVETPAGRLALVLLLAGGQPGSYGVAATANDGVLPSLPAPE
ncbi:MAG: copper transporter [Thermoleophilia bacterium]|nr:copper transporter [Thermoleophilia bacterium]